MAIVSYWFRLLVFWLEWVHACTIGPLVDVLDEGVLGSWEEAAKLFVREFFTTSTRLINGTCSFALALTDSNYRHRLRCTWQQKEAWHSWWREERQSTLNAVLAAQCPPSAEPKTLRQRNPTSNSASNRKQRKARISWQPDPQLSSRTSSIGDISSSCSDISALDDRNSNDITHKTAHTFAALDTAVADSATAAATNAAPPLSTAAAESPRGSWRARLVAKVELDLLGKAQASPDVLAEATGRSSNPLLQSVPSMPSLPSVPSFARLPSVSSLASIFGSNSGQQSQRLNPAGQQGSDTAGWADAAVLQEKQQCCLQDSRNSSRRGMLTWMLNACMLPLLPLKLLLSGMAWLTQFSRTQQPGLERAYVKAQQQGDSSCGRAAAGVARSARGLRRSIVFEQPSGFGVHEGSKRRGLLEELCLGGELCVTAVFDGVRWLVRVLTLTRPDTYRHYAVRPGRQQRQQAAAGQRGSRHGKAADNSCDMFGDGDAAWMQEEQQQQQQHGGIISSGDGGSAKTTVSKSVGLHRSKSVGADMAEATFGATRGSSALPRLTLRRVHSVSRWNHHGDVAADGSDGSLRGAAGGVNEELSSAAQMIIKAGYPLEVHTVTTADGCILRMERIPRTGCSRVAFFLHGILDTSLTWVSSGVTGSQAFAAWDQGFDVWLGSSRSNPPRLATDPAKQGLGYFSFTLNELGMHDIPAQIDHLHSVKMREMAGSSSSSSTGDPGFAQQQQQQQQGCSAVAESLGFNSTGSSRVDLQQVDPVLSAEGGSGTAAAAAGAAVHGAAAAGSRRPRVVRALQRTFSDSRLEALAAAAAADVFDPESSTVQQERATAEASGSNSRRRKGGLTVLHRVLAGMGVKQRQQQHMEAAPTLHAVAATTALHSTEQQYQQQQQNVATVVMPQLSSHDLAAAAAADDDAEMPLTPGRSLEVLIAKVSEPCTPELAESPMCGSAAAAAAAVGAAAAAITAAAAAASLGSSEAVGVQEQQQQGLGCVSPFTTPAVQQAAVAALLEDHSGSSSTAQQQQQQESTLGSSSSSSLSGAGSSIAMRRSQSSQALMSVSRHNSSSSSLSHYVNSGATNCNTGTSLVLTPTLQQQQQQPHTSSSSSAATAARVSPAPAEPYDLRVVAHSLGGLSVLMYTVMRSAAGQPHHVKRLVLMSPAGFHHAVPAPFWPIIRTLPLWHKFLVLLLGRQRAYHPVVLPSYIGRALTFSYFMEILRLPALADFTRAIMKCFFGGDASEWERALLMPHYSAEGMPACSLHQALHFIQIIHSGRFQLYDYGSAAANTARYGTPRPPDIGAQYWRLAGVHIDLLAGKGDGVVPCSNVRCHYQHMKEQGLQVSYREFAYGHMDFTFSVKEELRYYVMKCLNKRNT